MEFFIMLVGGFIGGAILFGAMEICKCMRDIKKSIDSVNTTIASLHKSLKNHD